MTEEQSWRHPALHDVLQSMLQVAGYSAPISMLWSHPSVVMLADVLSRWHYESDPWFFDTTLTLIIFGCRISELPTLTLGESGGCIEWSIYCDKQQVYREGKICIADANQLIKRLLYGCRCVYLDRGSYSYRCNRWFVDYTGRWAATINAKAHLWRHLWVTVLSGGCGVGIDHLSHNLRHQTLTTTFGYQLSF